MGKDIPYSREAEEYILGTILYNYDDVKALVDKAKPEFFYIKQNKFIAKAIHQLHVAGHSIDIVTVKEKLEEQQRLDKAGGYDKLSNLENESFAVNNFEEHIRILHKNHEKRKILLALQEASDNLMRKKPLNEVKSYVSQNLYTFDPENTTVEKGSFADFQRQSIEEKLTRTKVKSGLAQLDQVLSKGFAPRNMSLITARPSMGKSAFKQNIILNQVMRGISVLDLSLEMTASEELDRLISIDSGIPLYDIVNIQNWVSLKNGKLKTEMPKKLTLIKKTAEKLDNFDLYLKDGTMDLSDLRATILSYKDRYNIDVVYIDLIDRVQEVYRATSNKHNYIASVVGALADLAKQLEIHVCGLVQQKRRKKLKQKPRNDQIKGSGSYEENADLVIGVYREYVDDDDLLEDNIIEIYVRKQRQGETGKFEFNWDNDTLKISDGDIYE